MIKQVKGALFKSRELNFLLPQVATRQDYRCTSFSSVQTLKIVKITTCILDSRLAVN